MHPADPAPVFSRDLHQVEILSPNQSRRLFTLFVNHLKSRFVDPLPDHAAGTARANELGRRQAETAARIIEAQRL